MRRPPLQALAAGVMRLMAFLHTAFGLYVAACLAFAGWALLAVVSEQADEIAIDFRGSPRPRRIAVMDVASEMHVRQDEQALARGGTRGGHLPAIVAPPTSGRRHPSVMRRAG